MNLTPGAVPVLEEFDVTEIGKITTDLTGLGVLLNGIGEKILERRIKNSKERIMKELEHSVTTKIQEKFNAFK
ncbi:hypothetical protein SK128_015177 [Halocaridina rubra]|uniref:Uncharacterized protein n=1 Tax=Halocaridina rubra TaxID=373956 RepID=A0AAN8WYJ1_HALRR